MFAPGLTCNALDKIPSGVTQNHYDPQSNKLVMSFNTYYRLLYYQNNQKHDTGQENKIAVETTDYKTSD